MRIRPAVADDFADIARVHATCYQDSFRAWVPAEYLENGVHADLHRQWLGTALTGDDVVLVAEDRGIIGFIAVWCRPEPHIDNLYVLPERRSDGIGRRLMAEAARRLLANGYSSAHLWVLDGNAAAIRFYERLGGTATEREVQNRFGHQGTVIKFVWTDLSVMAAEGRSEPPQSPAPPRAWAPRETRDQRR